MARFTNWTQLHLRPPMMTPAIGPGPVGAANSGGEDQQRRKPKYIHEGWGQHTLLVSGSGLVTQHISAAGRHRVRLASHGELGVAMALAGWKWVQVGSAGEASSYYEQDDLWLLGLLDVDERDRMGVS